MVSSVCLAILMNCSATTHRVKDSELIKYTKEFTRLGKIYSVPNIQERVNNVEVKFGDTEDKEFAVCYPYFNQIVVNPKGWEDLPLENKEEVILHELGHCALGKLDHTETGIMKSAGLHSPKYYREHYNELMQELFDCTENCTDIEWNTAKYKPAAKEHQLTKAEILDNEHAVVRFTATWCPPCKALAPIFDEVAAENPSVKTYVVDVDQNQDLARDMGIRGIPALVKIKDKKVDQIMVGAQPKEKVKELFVK